MNIKLDGTDQRLWQWDKGRRVILDEVAPGTQIDFAHYDEKRAICKTAYAEDGVIYVDIPNILLQKAEHIYLYTYIVVGDTGKTSEYGELRVRKRPKPGDYVYEETEVLTWRTLDERIKALEDRPAGVAGTDDADYYATLAQAVADLNAGTQDNALDDPAEAKVKVYSAHTGALTVQLLEDVSEAAQIDIAVDLDLVIGSHALRLTTPAAYLNFAADTACQIHCSRTGGIIKDFGTAGSSCYAVNAAGALTIHRGSHRLSGANTSHTMFVRATGTCGVIELDECAVEVANTADAAGETRILQTQAAETKIRRGVFNVETTRICHGIYGMGEIEVSNTVIRVNTSDPTNTKTVHGIRLMGGNLHVSRSTIIADAPGCSADTAYSIGISHVAGSNVFAEDCYVFATHSGVSGQGNLYIRGGTYTGYSHGGFYFANGPEGINYINDATIRCGNYEGAHDFSALAALAGFYVGGGDGAQNSNVTVYMDGCTIGNAGLPAFVIRDTSGEQGNRVYISNSTILDEASAIRVDNETHRLYVGAGTNITADRVDHPEWAEFNDELYRRLHDDAPAQGADYNALLERPIPECSGGGGSSDPSRNVELDTTLTKSGAAADAKAVGDKIAEITGITLVEPAEDDIPKVFLTGDTTGMNKSTSVDLAFEYRSKTATHRGVANVKWQGSSSLSYPEKNYTIKLFTDAAKSEKLKLNMKGWGKENKFCLKANYVDTLHLRNLVGARIAYDMIKSRNDFASLPTEMQEAPRCGVVDGFPVKVFINGVLQGVYTWNIPKDKWCMNMDDENANHAFLMAEKNNNGSATSDALILACEFRANATIFADTSEAQYPPYDWVVEGPGDDVGTNIRESFNALINCVKDTDDATFKATIGDHLDLTSAFDYYSLAYLVCHYDGLGKNLGMATYDGKKWFCVPYDMDSIFGAKIDGSGFLATNRKCPEEYQETNSLLWQRIEKCFGAELYARYMELRNDALSLSNILTHAERFYDTIPSEYYAEDKAIWTGKPSKDTNTIGRLRNYIVERSSYVDLEMLAIGAGTGENPDENPDEIPCTGITLSASELTFTGAGTQTLTATVEPENTTDSVVWSSDNASVATVSGGVVTAKGNGSCKITATCGGFSANCVITVSGIETETEPVDGLVLHLDSSDVDTTSLTWADRSETGAVFSLTGGTPVVEESGLRMTSCRAVADKPVVLSGAFSYDIDLCIDESANGANAFFSFNVDNTTKYCDSLRYGQISSNGYSGDTRTGIIPPKGENFRLTIVRDATGGTKIFINNKFRGEFARGSFDANGEFDVVVGASSWDNFPIDDSKFNIKTLKIYDYALTDAEIGVIPNEDRVDVLSLMTKGKGVNTNTGEIKDSAGSWATEGLVEIQEPGGTYLIWCDATYLTVQGFDADGVYKTTLATGSANSPDSWTGVINYPNVRIAIYANSTNPTYCYLERIAN